MFYPLTISAKNGGTTKNDADDATTNATTAAATTTKSTGTETCSKKINNFF